MSRRKLTHEPAELALPCWRVTLLQEGVEVTISPLKSSFFWFNSILAPQTLIVI